MRIHPGLSLIALLGIAALAESRLPASVEGTFPLRVIPGALAFAAGTALLFWAIETMRREHTAIDPFKEPGALVTKGPFRYSRNPMYVANLLLMLGFVFLVGSAWFLLAAVTQFALLNSRVIPAEEQALRRLFPDAAQDWFSRTRRWL
jgi:protein-S-isoprenylcysteine O-methyltransferase Ste14